jgi:hypothetical protein
MKISDSAYDEIVVMLESFMSVHAIHLETGVSESTIYKIRRDRGITGHPWRSMSSQVLIPSTEF